jgi:hypothetical protein
MLLRGLNEFLPITPTFGDQLGLNSVLKILTSMPFSIYKFCENWYSDSILCLRAEMKFCPYFLHIASDLDKMQYKSSS